MPKRDSHGDEGESKGQGGGEDDLLAKAIKHCWSDNFLDVFRAYFRKHAEVFEVREVQGLFRDIVVGGVAT